MLLLPCSHNLDTGTIPEDVKPLLAVKMLNQLVDMSRWVGVVTHTKGCGRTPIQGAWSHRCSSVKCPAPLVILWTA